MRSRSANTLWVATVSSVTAPVARRITSASSASHTLYGRRAAPILEGQTVIEVLPRLADDSGELFTGGQLAQCRQVGVRDASVRVTSGVPKGDIASDDLVRDHRFGSVGIQSRFGASRCGRRPIRTTGRWRG
jgi:hypothetical protein